ncbi:MarR family winged helix-turn-helix transcriptional regulator [Actinoallomurus rhizosphaericola]|uniref:MarR family winged helix-turn-helix transcriptional regulator n=1 Tax=Actinoallomurus rhizosphaericola TaxID=2952536 RepID=UPI0020914ED5|nr:MarR family transcriptional regulator [Actinoallomurus rhizosphaericola]MCO5992076.1 MarR family transcriptional regulator [Actinoallomurus rhizosphaericola]
MDDEQPADGSGAVEIDLLAVLPRLMQVGQVMRRSDLVERTMERVGIAIDRPAMTILVTLHMADRPLRVGEIAERMQVVGPHVTRQMNVLERRGLARRITDPQDQRARLIELTTEGAAAADRYLTTMLGWFAGALAGWSPEDRQAFGRLLGRFADDLTAHLAALGDDRPPAS